jgi:hypothetical protein
LYGCGACPLTIREEHRLRVFDNRVLWREKWQEVREDCIMRSIITLKVIKYC